MKEEMIAFAQKREMARLLKITRTIIPLKGTEDLVMPGNFPSTIQSGLLLVIS